MKPEDKSKIQSLVSDLSALRSRNPEESKFKDWKEKTEKKIEEVFGKSSEQYGRFHGLRFFDFSRRAGARRSPRCGKRSARSSSRASTMRGGFCLDSWTCSAARLGPRAHLGTDAAARVRRAQDGRAAPRRSTKAWHVQAFFLTAKVGYVTLRMQKS